ncbi:response regulator receiver-modulated CheB methylesterase [Edaphobacter aggregans]|uniref:Protein-glutamate methylesterase/protein-glutamine glutaminase n=1 Tax=Edaphobacter aggregans TaxID=570835 RepID=A0A428MEH9_9BACT|nr:chemotaxis-specific protein-glutamate methyltransferase CheB [Edaphobacter aggregans]RSL15259.1 response regulator receiver-modulated CheB methylesterase [Edaphobacter aggregans]
MRDFGERPLRILAADDSAVMRGIMRHLFLTHGGNPKGEQPRMELCGVARDGVECLEAVQQLKPDVLVLDLEMPRLNGLEVLERLRRESPGLPVIMCSSHTEHGARSTLEGLARGASDYVMKPVGQKDFASALLSLAQQLLPSVAALAKGTRKTRGTSKSGHVKAGVVRMSAGATIELVVIGLSTGGPSALEQMLPKLSADFPVPVMIVQHMPKLFTGPLAERLNKCCSLRVEQAYDGAVLRPGTVWMAPGDSHMEVADGVLGEEAQRRGRVKLHQRELLNHCRPSVDYLFFSAARMYGAGTLALMMTGMGSDGLDGAKAVHERGGVVLAQDEATSAVWGMPGRVSEAGIASATLPLDALADELMQRTYAGRVRRMPVQHHAAISIARREVIHGLL